MTKEQYEKLKEWIRACIKTEAARDSSDGGLIEYKFECETEKELDKLMGFE